MQNVRSNDRGSIKDIKDVKALNNVQSRVRGAAREISDRLNNLGYTTEYSKALVGSNARWSRHCKYLVVIRYGAGTKCIATVYPGFFKFLDQVLWPPPLERALVYVVVPGTHTTRARQYHESVNTGLINWDSIVEACAGSIDARVRRMEHAHADEERFDQLQAQREDLVVKYGLQAIQHLNEACTTLTKIEDTKLLHKLLTVLAAHYAEEK